ncbi:MAG: hypothetical protein M1814_004416 [Vezdaea aestivalis]|nr:MAG: hypothetical protein M1814_004416 [Vezdaea aestivalis]
MTIELHVWGPTLGLPSLDPECLSAIAYLTSYFQDNPWVLVAAYPHPTSAPTSLPALYNPSSSPKWRYGFTAIHEATAHPSLTASQTADSIAFTAYAHSVLRPLVLQNLYLSPINYPIVRKAYTSLLPFPTQFFIPPRLRAAATKACAHLVSPIAASAPPSATDAATLKQNADAQAAIPVHLQPRASAGAAERENAMRRIRIADGVRRAFEPLDEILEKQECWILGTEAPAAVDYMLFGYLAVLLYADLPEMWAKDFIFTMERNSEVEKLTSRLLAFIKGQEKSDWKVETETTLSERLDLTLRLSGQALGINAWLGPSELTGPGVSERQPDGEKDDLPQPIHVFARAATVAAVVVAFGVSYVRFIE